jgi:hypothetical protein
VEFLLFCKKDNDDDDDSLGRRCLNESLKKKEKQKQRSVLFSLQVCNVYVLMH